jgi:hypothetical protein
MPEWAHVWYWLRFLREPRSFVTLPQQNAHPAVTEAEYDRLRSEWKRAGSPTVSPVQLVAAMTGVRAAQVTDELDW